MHTEKIEGQRFIGTGVSGTDSLRILTIVDSADMCYKLVRAGKGRSAITFYTPNYRTPVWLFRRVLRCDMSLQFLLSREGPLIVTAVVVAREVLAASTFY